MRFCFYHCQKFYPVVKLFDAEHDQTAFSRDFTVAFWVRVSFVFSTSLSKERRTHFVLNGEFRTKAPRSFFCFLFFVGSLNAVMVSELKTQTLSGGGTCGVSTLDRLKSDRRNRRRGVRASRSGSTCCLLKLELKQQQQQQQNPSSFLHRSQKTKRLWSGWIPFFSLDLWKKHQADPRRSEACMQ